MNIALPAGITSFQAIPHLHRPIKKVDIFAVTIFSQVNEKLEPSRRVINLRTADACSACVGVVTCPKTRLTLSVHRLPGNVPARQLSAQIQVTVVHRAQFNRHHIRLPSSPAVPYKRQ